MTRAHTHVMTTTRTIATKFNTTNALATVRRVVNKAGVGRVQANCPNGQALFQAVADGILVSAYDGAGQHAAAALTAAGFEYRARTETRDDGLVITSLTITGRA